jgi:hypothetical protein
LNFEFLLVLNRDDATWDCLNREDLGKRRMILIHNFGKGERNCRYFVVEKPHILFRLYLLSLLPFGDHLVEKISIFFYNNKKIFYKFCSTIKENIQMCGFVFQFKNKKGMLESIKGLSN